MAWWIWALLGIMLLVLELVTPGGLFALFFGIAALTVGALVAFGWAGPPWFQWLLFAALSAALVTLLRGRMRGALAARGGPVDALVGESAVLLDDLPPRGVGRAELRGSPWEARSASEAPLARGQRCRVERIEGLTLWLRPE
ncbi:MAG TPA: NfeD family protein [Anaeromyxobacteraceae bacterium]|nr:NfeD family protein [Anaeromyxobacteraceae bacterium]